MHTWMCVCVSACPRISTLVYATTTFKMCHLLIYLYFFLLYSLSLHSSSNKCSPRFCTMVAFHRPIPHSLVWHKNLLFTHKHAHRYANTSSYEYSGDLSEATVKSMTCVLKNWESFTLICFPGLPVSCCWAHSSTNRYKVTVSSLSVCGGVLTVLNSFTGHTNVLGGSDLRKTASISLKLYSTCIV